MKRIQRQRTKGWRMPEGAVYVGRPSIWGNPLREGDLSPIHGWPMSRQEAVDQFRMLMSQLPERRAVARQRLRGRDLVCWCPLDQPCHADVLLELVAS